MKVAPIQGDYLCKAKGAPVRSIPRPARFLCELGKRGGAAYLETSVSMAAMHASPNRSAVSAYSIVATPRMSFKKLWIIGGSL